MVYFYFISVFPGVTRTSFSDKEAKILARLNARKNRSAALQTAVPDATSSVSAPETQEVIPSQATNKSENVLLDKQQVITEHQSIKKLKRKNTVSGTEDGETAVVDEADLANQEPSIKRPKRKKMKKMDETVAMDGKQETKSVKPKKKKKKGIKVPKKEPVVEGNVTETIEDVKQPETELVEPTGEGFTVMEAVKIDKNQKIFRILPNWLAKPSIISCDLSNNKLPIREVKGLDKFLLETLKKNKIHHLFPGTYFSLLLYSLYTL
jgi:ATP-dependent RNA helicase DDX51/DBP6